MNSTAEYSQKEQRNTGRWKGTACIGSLRVPLVLELLLWFFFQPMLEFLDLRLDNGATVGLVGVAAVIILMVPFGLIKMFERNNFGSNRPAEVFLGLGL